MKGRTIATIGSFAIFVTTVAWFACMVRHQYLWSRQVNNLVISRTLSHQLALYHERFGKYPGELAMLRRLSDTSNVRVLDAWDRPFDYLAKDSGYILVSRGRNGELDSSDIWRYRSACLTTERAPRPMWMICGQWGADQVISDLGEHRICGK